MSTFFGMLFEYESLYIAALLVVHLIIFEVFVFFYLYFIIIDLLEYKQRVLSLAFLYLGRVFLSSFEQHLEKLR